MGERLFPGNNSSTIVNPTYLRTECRMEPFNSCYSIVKGGYEDGFVETHEWGHTVYRGELD